MIRFEGEILSPRLGVDIALTTHNLGTKLMRWMSSIDCDRAGVSSLTVYQCSDEGEVFTLPDMIRSILIRSTAPGTSPSGVRASALTEDRISGPGYC